MPIIIIFDNAYNKINVTPKGLVTRNRFAGTYVKLKSKLANKNMKLIGMFACVSSVNGAGGKFDGLKRKRQTQTDAHVEHWTRITRRDRHSWLATFCYDNVGD